MIEGEYRKQVPKYTKKYEYWFWHLPCQYLIPNYHPVLPPLMHYLLNCYFCFYYSLSFIPSTAAKIIPLKCKSDDVISRHKNCQWLLMSLKIRGEKIHKLTLRPIEDLVCIYFSFFHLLLCLLTMRLP